MRPPRRAGRRAAVLAAALGAAAVAGACRAPLPPGGGPARGDEPRADAAAPALVRVALATADAGGTLDAAAAWELRAATSGAVLARAGAGERYRVEQRGGVVVAAPLGGGRAGRAEGAALVARPTSPGGTVRWNGRRYRGELALSAGPHGLLVVNRLDMEDYLRGVVPREVGSLAPGDRAAVEAQAVAARSYARARLASRAGRRFDVTAGVTDQVYGGADAERPASDAAVAATAGLVLLYDGRVADAAYHSTCGGHTAAPGEVWRVAGAAPPYLRGVADRDARTGRAYCDVSPRFAWRRVFDRPALDASLARYLRALPGGRGGDGVARAVRVARRTPSGRVAELAVTTGAGPLALRGDEIRAALRVGGGAILHSTYFSVETVAVGGDGRVARLTLRGAGNGHGVGMCQWGAVGRARAGSDYRAILAAYYPGTTLGRLGGRGDAAPR